MKRGSFLLVAMLVIAAIIIFDPLQFFRKRGDITWKPRVDEESLQPYVEFAQSRRQSPEDFVISTFGSHDIVFLGELQKIQQTPQFVARLIPLLYAAGVRNLGIEYALSDSQAEIDALLSRPAYNELKARAIAFEWIVTWGFQEYMDIFKAAWQLNSALPAGASPMRIVGLSVRQNWEFLKTEEDAKNPETLAKIMANGIPDAHMAAVIEREFLRKGQKALVYCSIQHAFTRYRSKEYEKNAAAAKLSETRRAGNIVFDRIGSKAFTIYVHSPWMDASSQNGTVYPVDGMVDALIDALPAEKKYAGFNLAGTPLGELAVRASSYASGYQSLRLSDLCDGYVILGPISEYRAVTPIPDFVPVDGVDYAIRNFPGAKPAELSREDLNQAIVKDAETMAQMLSRFK